MKINCRNKEGIQKTLCKIKRRICKKDSLLLVKRGIKTFVAFNPVLTKYAVGTELATEGLEFLFCGN